MQLDGQVALAREGARVAALGHTEAQLRATVAAIAAGGARRCR